MAIYQNHNQDDNPMALEINSVLDDHDNLGSKTISRASHDSYAYQYLNNPSLVRKKTLQWLGLTLLVLLLFSGLAYGIFRLSKTSNDNQAVNGIVAENGTAIHLEEIAEKSKVSLNHLSRLDINGLVNINGTLRLSPIERPVSPRIGTIYLDKNDQKLYFFNGISYKELGSDSSLNQNFSASQFVQLQNPEIINTQLGSLALSGTVMAGRFVGSGASLANLNADNISTGILQNNFLTGGGLIVLNAGNGLLGGGGATLGSGVALSVNYGASSNSSVRGDMALICPSGVGNLTGGGSSITLGAGGSCGSLAIIDSPIFNGNLTVGNGFVNNGSTTFSTMTLGDYPAGGYIGLATATVDTKTTFSINQSSTGQIISLPSPSNSSAGRIVFVVNTGSADFSMHSVGIVAGGSQGYIFNGANWVPINQDLGGGSGGISIVGLLDGQAKNSNGATIAGQTIYLQTADSSNPGLISTGAQTFAGAKTFNGSIVLNGSNLNIANNSIITSATTISSVELDRLDGKDATLLDVNDAVSTAIVGTGTITTGTWQGTAVANAYVADDLTINASGSVDWSALTNYPGACSVGQAITQLGDTITCSTFAAGSGSGNYIQNTTTMQATANLYIQSNATTSVTARFRALAGQTADIIQVRDSTDSSTVFAISPSGVVSATSFSGNGASLTALDAGNISTGTLAVARGGTGATDASGARSNLGAAASGANSDITSLTGLTSITPTAGLTIGSTTQSLALQGNSSLTLAAVSGGFTTTVGFSGAPSGNVTYNFDRSAPAGTYSLCTTAGNCLGGASGGANTSLSNLTAVAINTSLLPGATTIDLGSAVAPFREMYLWGTGSSSVKLTTTATTAQTVTFPDATGTVCLSTGNCAGVGGTGDILNNGQNGVIRIGTNDATALYLETNNIDRLGITSGGDVNIITGSLQTAGTTRITGAGVLQNVTADASIITTGTVGVARGGTGAGTFTQYGIMYGNGTGALGVTAVGTTNQCLLGVTGGAPVWGSCTAGGGGFSSLTLSDGTNTQSLVDTDTISVLGGSNITSTVSATDTVTLAVVNNPTFSGLITGQNGLTVSSGSVTVSNLNTAGLVQTNGSGVLSTGTVDRNSSTYFTNALGVINGGTGATDASGARSNLGAAASGANSDITSLTGLTSITPTAGLTIGSTTQSLALQGNSSLTLAAVSGGFTTTVGFSGAPSGNVTYNFDRSAPAGTYSLCTTAGNCLGGASGGANTSLSNLTAVAINTSLLPGATTIDLGSAVAPFREMYLWGTGSSSVKLTTTATTAQTVTFPDATGTVCLSTGNCAGVGGTGDILNNGQNGVIRIGTNDATALYLETNNIDRLGITSGGDVNIITGSLQTAGTTRITGAGVLQNVTADASIITTGTVGVARGGTGAGTFTQYGIMYGNGTGALGVTAVGTTNQCLLGVTGGAPVWGSCTAGGGGFSSLTLSDGTNTQSLVDTDTISVLGGSNITSTVSATDTVTLAVVNNPTFSGLITGQNGLTVSSGSVTVSNLNTAGLVQTNGSGVLSTGTVDRNSSTYFTNALGVINGGTGATDASGARSNLGAAASGANSDITSLTGLTSITPTAGLTIGSTTQSLALQGNSSLTLAAVSGGFTTTVGFSGAPSGNVTYNFDRSAPAGTYSLCTTAGNCLGGASGGANTSLSNLTAVAINTSLLPGATTIDLGSAVAPFREMYLWGTGSSSVKLTTTATTAQTVTFPDATGTVCLSTGNCAGVGGTGDILNNGQNGVIRIGTNDATALYLETNNIDRLGITSGGDVNIITGSLQTAGTTRITGAGVLQNVTADASIITTGTVGVARGGTGAGTFTQYGIMYGNGTGALGVTAVGTTNQCLLGVTGGAPVWGSCTAGGGGFSSLTLSDGTNTQSLVDTDTISVLGGSNITSTVSATDTVTLAVVNNPTFSGLITGQNGLTVSSGSVTVSNLNTAGLVQTNGSGVLSTGTVDRNSSTYFTNALGVINGGTGATDASGARSNLGAAASGANSDITSLTGLTSITPTAGLTIGSTTQSLALQGNSSLTLAAVSGGFTTTVGFSGAPSGNVTYNFDRSAPAGTYSLCTTAGNCLGGASGGANTSLSNLTAVAINTSLLPGATTIDLGSAVAPFREMYLWGTGSSSVKLTTTATTAQTVTFPDATGTVCLSTGNCAGVGGTGDILNNGQNGVIRIGTNDATALYLETNNIDRLGITSGGDVNIITGSLQTAGTTRITGAGVLQNVTADASIITTGTVGVARGGTGAGTFTQYGIMYGNGTGALGVTAVGTTNQCLLGVTGGAPVWGSCTAGGGGFSSLTLSDGTNTQSLVDTDTISVLGGSNITSTVSATDTVTLAVVNNPTFSGLITGQNGLTVSSGSVTVSNLNTAGLVQTNGSGVLSTGTVDRNSSTYFTNALGVINGGTGATTLSGLLIGNGASAFTATTNSAGISGILSDETGSGALVFATSPTVTTLTVASGGIGITAGGLTVSTGTTTINGGLNVGGAGSVAIAKGTDFSTTGTVNAASFTGSLIRYTGAGTMTLNGITGASDGRIITLINTTANNITINNQNASAVATERIITGTTASITLTQDKSISFQYDTTTQRWRVINSGADTDTGVTAVGSISGSNANGLNISGNTINLTIADGTNGGALTAGAQTIGGAKTFASLITGSAGITTTGGAVSLTGNAASSLTTTAGALTLTSATATTWSTTAGNLTLQAGSGTVSLGTSTALTASGALGITSGGANGLTLDTGGAATLSVGTTNANALSVSRSGITTTVNGILTVAENTNLNGNTTIGNATTDRLTVTSQILGGSPLVFQGATDNGFATTLAITNPTANNTITLPDASGTVLLAPAGSGNGLVQVPTSNTAGVAGANIISPTGNGIVGLKVNATTGTATNALQVNTLTTADNVAQVAIGTGATGNRGLVVQGVSGQIADYLQVQDSTGVILFQVLGDGSGIETNDIYAHNLKNTSTGANANIALNTTGARITTSVASNTALAIRNDNISPSGYLLTVENNVGTVLAGFNASGNLFYSNSTYSSILQSATLTGSRTITLPNETGTICTTGSVCAGYAPSATNGYVQLAPATAQTDASTNSSIFINKTGASGNILQLQKSGTDAMVLNNAGSLSIRPTTNTASALSILNSSGTTTLEIKPNISTNNIFVGTGNATGTVTGVNNVGFGQDVFAELTSGDENVAVGNKSLQYNTTGFNNTAQGFGALQSNTTGYQNTAVGSGALTDNTIGYDNTAIGNNSLYSNIDGLYNLAIGSASLFYNTTADQNTAIGVRALYNATASDNTALGFSALEGNTTGYNNIALGSLAGDNITTGNTNIMIGYDIDAQSATGSNQLSIGNIIFGGGGFGTGTTVGSGNVGIGGLEDGTDKLRVHGDIKVGTGGTNGCVKRYDGTALTGTCSSDERFKENIGNMTGILDKVAGLQAVTYNFNQLGKDYTGATGSEIQYGLIAQQVMQVAPELVVTDENGYLKVRYELLPIYAISAIGEQQTQINDAVDRLTALENSIQPANNNILDLTNGGTIQGNLNIIGNLNVTGPVTMKSLTVTDDVVIAGNLSVQNITVANITVNGHIITAGNTPTATIGTAAGVEDTLNNIPAPQVTIEGNDTAGTITITVGANTTAGILAEVKFDKPFGGIPKAIVSAKTAESAWLQIFNETNSDKFMLKALNSPNSGQTYKFDYFIVQ